MKLEARTRLLAAPSRDVFPVVVEKLASVLEGSGVKFVPYTRVGGDMFPALARIEEKNGGGAYWNVSVLSQKGAEILLSINLDVETSNSIYRGDSVGPWLERQTKSAATIAKVLKRLKLKPVPVMFKSQPDQVSHFKITLKLDPSEHERAQVPLKEQRIWVIEVTGERGNRRRFSGTENSIGPWTYDSALMHINDLAKQLAYDDEFKHPTFRVVQKS